MMKNNLIALLDQTCPGVNALFDNPVREDGHQKWVDFSASFRHIDCVRSMSKPAFVQQYAKWCKQHGYQARAGRAEGKPYLVYMTAGANKFLRICYGRVKEYLASLEQTSVPDQNQYT